jgi:virginiamycin B lyase
MTIRISSIGLGVLFGVGLMGLMGFPPPTRQRPEPARNSSLTSADWLGLLPEGEAKRRFILDCTGCHQFDERMARVEGRPRTAAEWEEAVTKMLSFSGATTGFPVIAHDRNAAATAKWLAANLGRDPVERPVSGAEVVTGAVTEYDPPVPQDLPHDIAVDAAGRVVVTGMFSHQMFVLDPATARFEAVSIPVPKANPRAVEIDSTGDWWVVFGQPMQVGRYRPGSREWKSFQVGFYPHSLALGRPGEVWVNGHFTRNPELIARIDVATAGLESFHVTPHPTLAVVPGGPIPYEIRIGPDGRVWGSELQGNRVFVLDPSTRAFRTYDMPVPHSGPRRLDLDRQGRVWIPAYATNELVLLDPGSGTFTRYTVPIPDAVPYVVRIDHGTGRVWLGTAAADAIVAFDPADERFTVYPLPSRGALVRHLAVDPRTHDLWVAYGASPGPLPSRIARVRVGERPASN